MADRYAASRYLPSTLPKLSKRHNINQVIQRMIIKTKIPQKGIFQDVSQLMEFINYGILPDKTYSFVNNRHQSFKQVVNEFIRTQSYAPLTRKQ